MSDKWKRIVDSIKAFVGLFTMSMGFWISYVLVWFGVGLPQTDWALWVCLALGLLSHRVYLWWLERGAAADDGKESLRQALSIIHRQQAKIVRLNGELITEKTRRENAVKAYHEAKAEAIKEVVEIMKPWYKLLCIDEGDWCHQLDALAYNLTKEMVGDSDA